MKIHRSRLPLLLFFLTAVSTVSAHPGHPSASGIASGFFHPFSGWDHLLAMLAIGFWAAQLGGRARWRVPAIFTGVMALGAVAGHWIGLVPGIDQGAAASVLVLGLLIATATRIPAGAGFALVSLFAIFHGFAHGAEMPATSGALGYGLGFMVASLLLNAAGSGLGFTAARFSTHASRWIGWGFAAAGLAALAG